MQILLKVLFIAVALVSFSRAQLVIAIDQLPIEKRASKAPLETVIKGDLEAFKEQMIELIAAFGRDIQALKEGNDGQILFDQQYSFLPIGRGLKIALERCSYQNYGSMNRESNIELLGDCGEIAQFLHENKDKIDPLLAILDKYVAQIRPLVDKAWGYSGLWKVLHYTHIVVFPILIILIGVILSIDPIKAHSFDEVFKVLDSGQGFAFLGSLYCFLALCALKWASIGNPIGMWNEDRITIYMIASSSLAACIALRRFLLEFRGERKAYSPLLLKRKRTVLNRE